MILHNTVRREIIGLLRPADIPLGVTCETR